MINVSQHLETYADLTASEQAMVREAVLAELVAIDSDLHRILDRAVQLYTQRLVPLETFVSSHASDFEPAEATDLVTARTRIRGRFAAAANSIPGVSGATAT